MIQNIDKINSNSNTTRFILRKLNKTTKAECSTQFKPSKNYYPSDYIDDYWFNKINYLA